VVDLDAPLGQQFLDVAMGQAVPQLPAHRHRYHLPRGPIPNRSCRHFWLGRHHQIGVSTRRERPMQQCPAGRPGVLDQRRREDERRAAAAECLPALVPHAGLPTSFYRTG
jgi:hypothetical protein